MKKLIEIDPSYYRLNLYAGNIIYLSHAKKVHDDQYIDLTVKDIISKIDELVEAYNNISEALGGLGDTAPKLQANIKELNARVIKLEAIAPKLETEITYESKDLEDQDTRHV